MDEEFESVHLQPFLHQVSGHRGIFLYNDRTVCKPLNVREYNFYLNIPHILRSFTAEFRGEIEAEIREGNDGRLTVMGRRPKSTDRKKSVNCEDVSDSVMFPSKVEKLEGIHSLQLLRSDGIEIVTQTDQLIVSRDVRNDCRAEMVNPWSLRCQKKMMFKLKKVNHGPVTHCDFILLENVAARFRHPCILDLKMGTRQHGDDVSPEKKERFTERCRSTTSSSLGVRIGGMQVYRGDGDQCFWVNKIYGRSLGVDGFKQTLHQFLLHDFFGLRKDLLDPIIDRLKDLHRNIQSCDTYRFYSSSLLIVYDACCQATHLATDLRNDESCGSGHVVEVRLIDFAHFTRSGFQNDTTVHIGPDRGFLFGLENLIDIFSDMRCIG